MTRTATLHLHVLLKIVGSARQGKTFRALSAISARFSDILRPTLEANKRTSEQACQWTSLPSVLYWPGPSIWLTSISGYTLLQITRLLDPPLHLSCPNHTCFVWMAHSSLEISSILSSSTSFHSLESTYHRPSPLQRA